MTKTKIKVPRPGPSTFLIDALSKGEALSVNPELTAAEIQVHSLRIVPGAY